MSDLPLPLLSAALARPQHLAVVAPEGAATYLELSSLAARIAGGLIAQGIGPGQVIGLFGPPSIEWVAAFHAIGAVGAAVAPIPCMLGSGPPEAPLHPQIDRYRDVVALERVVTTGAGDRGALEVRRLRDAAPMAEERFWPLGERRLVLATSGSTGAQKKVELTTEQLVFSAFGSSIRLGHHLDDRWLLCLPLHHVGGLMILVRAAFGATTVHLLPRFVAGDVAKAIDEQAVSLVSLVPVMAERVLEARGERPFPRSLRAILLGGDHTPPTLIERLRALGAPVALTWGMTEAASQIATTFPGQATESAGPPLPFARVRAEGALLEVQGPLVGGRKHLTRDRGVILSDGQVRVLGRDDDVFISGGENADPVAIEDCLSRHPLVAEVLAVALPDPRWGQRAHVLVVGRDAQRPDLIAWCKDRLAPHEVPSSVHWVEALPLGPTGKPSRDAGRRLLTQAEPAPTPRTPPLENTR